MSEVIDVSDCESKELGVCSCFMWVGEWPSTEALKDGESNYLKSDQCYKLFWI